jgi:hypothetical protein
MNEKMLQLDTKLVNIELPNEWIALERDGT